MQFNERKLDFLKGVSFGSSLKEWNQVWFQKIQIFHFFDILAGSGVNQSDFALLGTEFDWLTVPTRHNLSANYSEKMSAFWNLLTFSWLFKPTLNE